MAVCNQPCSPAASLGSSPGRPGRRKSVIGGKYIIQAKRSVHGCQSRLYVTSLAL